MHEQRKTVHEDIVLAVKIAGRPGYMSIGEDSPDNRKFFEQQGGEIVLVPRHEATRGFHEFAESAKRK